MNEITKLLKSWKSGDKEALDQLITLIVPELKKIAHKYMSAEKPGNILQTTALVNEALIKMISEKISFEDRKHFYRSMATRMRHILVDEARRTSTAKRGKGAIEQFDDKAEQTWSVRPRAILKLNEVLEELAKEDEQRAVIVENHFFVGLSFTEVAELMGLSKAKVEREWNRTRLQLKRAMTEES